MIILMIEIPGDKQFSYNVVYKYISSQQSSNSTM